MNEDDCCLICLDETLNVNCVLDCCKKKVHSSCIKQWWNMQNMELNNASCPHCTQKAKLKKINPTTRRIVPINNNNQNFEFENQQINPAYGVNQYNIRPNEHFDLTDDDIIEINSNHDNFIPRNTFRLNRSESNDSFEHVEIFNFLKFLAVIGIIGLILLIAYVWLKLEV